MIEVRALCRCYGELRAVDDVSFDIGRREIVGLLGHNGAGKTTIMKMLTGFLEPSSGSIRIGGQDIAAHRREVQRRIGYLPENCPLYPDMSVVDHLDYQAALHGIPVARRGAAMRRAIERTELGAKAMAPVATLSRGYRQRLGVALAILHEPDILILDEPTNGLDPSQIQHMRGLIRELAEQATVIISTHILQEVEAICGRVLIMRGGRLALDSRLDDIGTRPRLLVTLDRDLAEVRSLFDGLGLGAQTDVEQLPVPVRDQDQCRTYAISAVNPLAAAPRVAEAVAAQGWALYGLELERQDLEALFGAVSGTAAGDVSGKLMSAGTVAKTASGTAPGVSAREAAAHV
ncbi:ABC transporter ATP-binding protein [Thiohalocapsa marina]|uniref:ABC transporter ATP-binding protein n=1 Tax=Thiohalocapsa marina TaxID=424902 RepID=A0A5M8FHT3_9GAMM|nr:ABC transporter ATP-binding protein [Thiohalocapsa marina]KAA6183326.1 ABC transporter ATP-binding protein [Thiohalocapsa marina]